MPPVLLRPYRMLDDDAAFAAGPWFLSGDLLESFVDWHPGLDIDLYREFTFDIDAAEEAIGPAARSLVVAAEWQSDSVLIRESCASGPLESASHELRGRLDGLRIGGRLTLRCVVVVGQGVDGRVGYPSKPGEIVWEDRWSIDLEGEGAQFALRSMNFEATTLPKGASWVVEVEGLDGSGAELHAPSAEGVSLLINQGGPAFASLTDGPPTPLRRAMAKVMAWDLARKLLLLSSVDPDFDPDGEYSEGSLGELLQITRQILGQKDPPDQIARTFREQPNILEAQIQAAIPLPEEHE